MSAPSKPPFDPRIHLLDDHGKTTRARGTSNGEDSQPPDEKADATKPTANSRPVATHVDDETIARLLHEQMLWDDQRTRATMPSVKDDEQYARMMQNEFEAVERSPRGPKPGLLSDPLLSNLGRDAGIADRLEYARRMQAQTLYDIKRNPGSVNPVLACHSNDDIELARHLQEMEAINLGSPTPHRTTEESADGFAYERSIALAENLQSGSALDFVSQEEEDARLARMMARTGQSLRSLQTVDVLATPNPIIGLTEQEENDARLARMMEETGDSLRDLVDEPNDAQQLSLETSLSTENAPKDGNSMTRTTLPTTGQPKPTRPSAPNRRGDARSPPPTRTNVYHPPSAAVPGVKANEMNNANRSIPPPKEKAKKRLGLLNFSKKAGGRGNSPLAIPAPIPPPPARGQAGPLPYSESVSRNMGGPVEKGAQLKKKGISLPTRSQNTCSVCHKAASTYVMALNKKYHLECFCCMGCNEAIDPSSKFAFMSDDFGERFPLHGSCYEELYGVKCAVCRQSIPSGPDGKVSYVKHPFFDTEQMCPSHATNPGRRCTGCHRFEPEDRPFADLFDANRCVCFSCCRTVVVDSGDAEPLWERVVTFFEEKLSLPIWPDMKKVPVLVVGYEALNVQLMESGGAHGGSSQIMTRGLCLTEHQSGRKLQLSRMRFDQRSGSFQKRDMEEQGFTYYRVPDPNKVNPDASVTCILCLSGLPADLTASVLAHEATHAWIKLHPNFDVSHPIPPKVEEGVAQLVAMLFLTEGLAAPSKETHGDDGPTEEKLRQYFKFSIETDDHEIYGEGYRRAATAYAAIGLQALLSHIILYQEFPHT